MKPALLLTTLLLCACDGSDGGVRTAPTDTSSTAPALQADPANPDADSVAASSLGDAAQTSQVPGAAVDAAPTSERPAQGATPESGATQPPVSQQDDSVFAPLPSDLMETQAIYAEQGYEHDDVIRIDLRTVTEPGICSEQDESGCTLDDIIADTDSNDRFKPDIAVHFSASDFPDDGTRANAELRQRGGFTRFAPQKSFRIRLDDKDTPWRGERKLLLNKHPYENARIRNALAMELFAGMPHLFSFRTQFANLWIDDTGGAEDYGLFTQVEEPGKRWLERRGLDTDGRLYKPELFRFAEQERDALRVDDTGEPLDEEQFETYLEIEAGNDHRALTRMMDALHDPQRSFESVLDEHFNRNNIQAWLAMNILLHQTEAIRHNFVLYNPAGTERFYFVPWDYDATFAIEQEPAANATDDRSLGKRLRYGYARNVDSEVIRRFLQLPGAHERMVEAAGVLQERYLGIDAVKDRADAMALAVAPWLQRAPDLEHLANYDATPGAHFLASIDGNAEALRNRFAMPLPPLLHEPSLDAGQWVFSWRPALEITGSALSYDLLISRTPDFADDDIIARLDNLPDSARTIEHRIDAAVLGSGTRYVRIIARSDLDPARFWQVSDNVIEEDGETRIGMRRFEAP